MFGPYRRAVRFSCVDAHNNMHAFVLVMFVHARCHRDMNVENIQKKFVKREDDREAVRHRYYVEARRGDQDDFRVDYYHRKPVAY